MSAWTWTAAGVLAWFAASIPIGLFLGPVIRRAASQDDPAPGAPPAAPPCPQAVEPLSPAPGLTPRTLIATIPIYGHRRQLIAAAELYGCDCYVIRAHTRRVIYRWWCEGHGHFARWEKELVQ